MLIFRNIISFLKEKRYRSLTVTSLIVLINGTVVYHYVEGFSWVDSLYFSVITLNTVGYGDLAPATDFGKIFTVIYVLTGIGIIFGFINAFTQHRISKIDKHVKERKEKFEKR